MNNELMMNLGTAIKTPEDTFDFKVSDSTEVLRLDKQGFHYKGQVIDDAGEAHRLFVEYMKKTNMQIPV